jgi:cytochrome c-type biogenesis protein
LRRTAPKMEIFADTGTSFILGILTPLTAVCVLPLYPGFLSYLANQLKGKKADRKTYALFGLVAALGVLAFMSVIGLIFTTIFQVSLTNVIGIISPIAFGVLLIISLMMIFDVDFTKVIPAAKMPKLSKNPMASAFTFGFFFGAIVIPCNPALIAAFFALSTTATQFASNIISFIAFGLGLGFPLLLFSLLSSAKSTSVINFLTKYKKPINLVFGVFMLMVSMYYLLCVFSLLGDAKLAADLCRPLSLIFSKFVEFGSGLL